MVHLGGGGGTALEQESVACVTHSHRLGRGRKGQFVVRASIAEDLTAVPAMVLLRQRHQEIGSKET